MKRSIIKGIQIVCILPATLSVPFVLEAIPAAILDLLDHTSGLPEVALTITLAVSILSGVMASWAVISSRDGYFRKNATFKRKVRIGLALGALGGCAVLIWATKFIAADTGISAKRGAIVSGGIFCGPSILLVIFQFIALTRTRNELPSEKGETMP